MAATRGDLDTTSANLAAEANRLTKARAKWGEDKGALERAKDALAAALSQIEDAENRPFD